MQNQENKLILLEDLGLIYPNENSKQTRKYGIYKCFCGNEFKAQEYNVKSRITQSCGCLNGVKHGLAKHRLYKTWRGMIHRCTNQNNPMYENYGGRGITICNEWLDVQNFINDMFPTYKDGLSIDRIDNNKGYSKDNCRWTDRFTQSQNTIRIRSNNTSGYRGVSWNLRYKKWLSSIRVNNKQIILGYYEDKLEAAKVYDDYIVCNNLKHTKNF